MSTISFSDARLSYGSESQGVKRKRKVLACAPCRRQKLRCDRERPICGRCSKVGQPQNCDYTTFQDDNPGPDASYSIEAVVPGVLEAANGTTLTNSVTRPAPAKIESVSELRPTTLSTVSDWEHSAVWLGYEQGTNAKIASQAATEVALSASADGPRAGQRLVKNDKGLPVVGTGAETIIFRGSDFSTQYYGGTHAISSMAHFPDLQRFMKEALSKSTALAHVQRSLKALQLQWKREHSLRRLGESSALFDLLPDRLTVDALVRLYFDTYGALYCIVQQPWFWTEYQRMWDDQSTVEPAIISMVLLIIASVDCIYRGTKATYMGDSSAARERATYWIDTCESWLERQSQKEPGLVYWQIRCLVVIAKLPNVVKKKRAWSYAGDLFRQVVAAGFHRDPSVLSTKMAPVDEELRRRIWATVVELELQASLDRGMPSAFANTPNDCGPISKSHDLTSEHSTTGPSVLEKESKSATYLYLSRNSLSLRVGLATALNQLGSHPRHEVVMAYDEQIMQRLQDLSDSAEFAALSPLQRTLLDLQLRQFLLMLHLPYARADNAASKNTMSKIACLSAASNIIDQVSKLSATDRSAVCFVRTDVFRSALVLCQVLYVARTVKADAFLQNIGSNCETHVEQVLSILDERITQLGTGYTHFWYVSAAYGLLRTSQDPSRAEGEGQRAVDRVTKQYYKVLASQDEVAPVAAGPKASATSSLEAPQMLDSLTDPNFDEFFFGDPAAWTFDNLWPSNDVPLPHLQV